MVRETNVSVSSQLPKPSHHENPVVGGHNVLGESLHSEYHEEHSF